MLKSASLAAGAFLLAGAISTSALPAAQASPDEQYDHCIDANPNADNKEWTKCGVDFVDREEDRLTTTWKRVFGSTSGKTRGDLLAEQRAWIAFKEKSCLFYANGDFGREGMVLHFYACRGAVIADRRHALEAYGSFFNQ
jgi:uncharacterized protein YecT (DUF1311 family)